MDGTVAVFDTATGKPLLTLGGHFKPVRDLTFTPGEARPGTTHPWQRTSRIPTGCPYHCCCCIVCEFADSKQVITACDDNHAHLYDAEHGELIEAFSGG